MHCAPIRLACVLLTAAGGLLAAIPWLAAGRFAAGGGAPLGLSSLLDGPGAAFALGLVVLGVSLAHLASVAYSSRSYWLALDMLLFLAWLVLFCDCGACTAHYFFCMVH